MKCKYKTGELSGLECPCEKCAKVRDFLFQKELDGEVNLIGEEKHLKQIRR